MKFHLAINLERMDESVDMQEVQSHVTEMVQIADKAGFEIVWAAEHHALEMTIAPNPFQLLTWWAAYTNNIRLGSGVANAAYWHPINLAGEAAMVDLISNGRLEFGLGSGAYQREFDRMRPGVSQKDGHKYLAEALPVVQALWQGDVTHNGEFWSFPKSTSCPKPVQKQVPIWVAARSASTFDHAVEMGANIMSWPLAQPFSEAEKYRSLLDEAIEKSGKPYAGNFAMMRHTSVWNTDADREATLHSIRNALGQFGNLMMKAGDVKNGFPDKIALEDLDGNARVDPEMLEENLIFGTPDTVVQKLKKYEALGVDSFIYYASMGQELEVQKRSLNLFIDRVMPEFS
jgi:alkanesulfonate monooxygenase SsuD/methylene tetrahydromethanopterin reductase-like flavin-dependent oxidoreductase (luciferase family)